MPGASKHTTDGDAQLIKVLKAVANARQPVGAKDVAEILGINHTTAWRKLQALESENMVSAVGDKYKLGMGAALLWARMRANIDTQIESLQEDLRTLDITEEA